MARTTAPPPEPEETTGALIQLEQVNLPALFTTGEGLDAFLALMRKHTADLVPDTSTEKGRKEIRSLAYRVARTKTLIEEQGKTFTEERRRELKTIDANRARIRDELDALRDEVRKPVDDWQAAEDARIEAELAQARAEAEAREAAEQRAADIRSRIRALEALPAGYVGLELAEAERRYAELRDLPLTEEQYGDQLAEAERVRDEALAKIDQLLTMQRKVAKLEAEAAAARAAEEERVRQSELMQQEEEARAKAAEAARLEAEAAERERAHALQQKITGLQTRYLMDAAGADSARIETLIGKLEAETIDAAGYGDRVDDAAESAAIALSKLQAMLTDRRAAEEAEAARKAAEAEAEALRRAEAARLAAEKAEADRLADEQARREKAAAKASHRKRIKAEVAKAMAEYGVSDADEPGGILDMIEAGEIPHVSIQF